MNPKDRLKPVDAGGMETIRIQREQARALKIRYTRLDRFNALIFILVMIALIVLIVRVSIFDTAMLPGWTHQALIGAACALAASMIVGFFLHFNLRRQAALCRAYSFYTAIQDERLRERLGRHPRLLARYRELLASQGLIYQYQIDILREELDREEGDDLHSRLHLKAY